MNIALYAVTLCTNQVVLESNHPRQHIKYISINFSLFRSWELTLAPLPENLDQPAKLYFLPSFCIQ